MERRVLFAVFLSFLVLMVYQTLVVKPRTKPPATAPSAGTPAGTALPPADLEAGRQAAAPTTPTVPTADVVVGDTAEREIVVETDTVRAVFSNRGGVLRSWRLKHYFDSNGAPIDMLPSALQDPSQKPFSLTLDDEALTKTVNGALYRPSENALSLGARAGSLAFSYRDATGLDVQKTFEIQTGGQAYVMTVTAVVTRNGQPWRASVNGGAGFGDFERGVKPSGFLVTSMYQPPQAIYQDVPGKPQRVGILAGAPATAHEGPFQYVGVDDHYFLATLLPGERRARVEYHGLTVPSPAGPRDVVEYRVKVSGDGPMRFFYGPKEFDVLEKVHPELVRTIHFGIFGFLATPLLQALKWVNHYVGNYGWSIILLTVVINLLMFPLRHKSAVSMRKMQQIQPQVKAIQDRYSKLKVTDPARQKMNTEMMNLYREKGVNPASGCVPMLMTFPVLFAFYALLSVAIELRGAPWMGWIKDLSTYDPLFITPILMGASQFWQTKMMPATGDPTQQKMMMFMPLIFLVFFLWAPSGLVIYWLVSNLWTIGQQYLTNRMLGGPPVAGSRPPDRRPKKLGEAAI